MTLIIWITQSCLLSVAIFLLLGEELVLDRKEDLLCLKAIRVAAASDNTQQYSNSSQCCKLEKSAKWKIAFGAFAVAQTSLLFVSFGLRSHSPRSLRLLPVVCIACWLVTVIILLTKLIVLLTPAPQTVADSGYMSMLFTFAWNSLRSVFSVGYQRIFHVVLHSISGSDNREGLQNGLYFCSFEESKDTGQNDANTPRVIITLIVAYFISSGYTLVLFHEEQSGDETDLKPSRSTRLRSCQKRRDRGWDNFDMGEEGEGKGNKTTGGTCASLNCLHDLNKNDISVAFMEESDDESFVFGWRL